eukprot:CAMPEP_0197024180 /NCGR_PEP_ID=MMETSP1384-20130603/4806_1 /TAXON_ID=29189 /ORGANISM="Ammonia sp." /LENGTH=709 /DNA_ID=CAMNT_0042452525 /DNA_START=28 /DNA_END=2154 /DNA_ORIENTATION=+
MPAKKKNARKRARDDSDQPAKAPPNKRAKKAAPNTDESQYVRRSRRTRRAPAEYWKTNQSSESDNESESESEESSNAHDSDNDSVQTDKTFEPQIRSKRTGSQRNKANNEQTKSSQQPKRSKSNNHRNKKEKNKKASDKQRRAQQKKAAEPEEIANGEDGSVSPAEIGSNTEKEEIEVNANVDSDRNRNRNHNANARSPRRRTDTDLLSPHRRQIIDDLPPRMSNISILNRREHRNEEEEGEDGGGGEDVLDLKAIEKVIKESGVIRKSLIEIKKKHDEHYKDLSKSEEQTRTELNESIEVFNTKYNELKKTFEASKKSIFKDIESLKANEEDEQHQAHNENEYKLLYEKSTKKIKILNDEIVALQHELRQKNEENKDLRQKARKDLVEYEENKRKELTALNGKYKLDINELEFKLKCVEDEYAEYKDNMDGKIKIHDNNQNLMIDNLKRENAALYAELSQYHQTEKTATPNSAILTPINHNNNANPIDFRTRIRESPLTEKVQNELISISNAKELENEIANLKQEMLGAEKQLSAKKQLIKEFEELLRNDQIALKKQESERDVLLTKMTNMKKIINIYSILTSTKIQEKIEVIEEEQENTSTEQKQQDIDDERERGKREKYLCRTVNKENKRMLEYYLTLAVNDQDKEHSNDNEDGDNNHNREEEERQIHCHYELVSAHNLSERAASNKKSCLFEENMVFYTKQAPLW